MLSENLSLEIFSAAMWNDSFAPEDQRRAVNGLEDGRILYFRHLPFQLDEPERFLLATSWSDQKAKNISLDPVEGKLRGTKIEGPDNDQLTAMMRRYASYTQQFLQLLLPTYAPRLQLGRTSFRPQEIEGREPPSYRKDDRRLHLDTFPSRPCRGARILRVFTNINPAGKPRMWLVGEPFETFAGRFLPRVRPALPGLSRIEYALGITKKPRTPYDHIMLQLHDRAKGDVRYQREAPRQEIAFEAGSTWVVFTDQVAHAATSGQFALEQTFELPVAAQQRPDQSPLRVLERMTGRSLAPAAN